MTGLDATESGIPASDSSLYAGEHEEERKHVKPSHRKLVLKNVRVFDGTKVGDITEVAMDAGRIVADVSGGEEFDCNGRILFPGFIDAHCHPSTVSELRAMSDIGVTTAMCMAGFSKGHNDSLKGHVGLTDVHVTGLPAVGPSNSQIKFIPNWPKDEILTHPSQAEAFVDSQLAKGAEYIKVIADIPGMEQEIINAIADAARKRQKLIVCHAAKVEAVRQALRAQAHQIHHSPMDGVLHTDDIELYKRVGSVNCPTLAAMEMFDRFLPRPGLKYANARENVAALRKAGVTVLAGTDANEAQKGPVTVPFATSFHRELELLVEAGLTTLETLRAATSLPAKHFNLNDRGVVAPGYRADLVLLVENPLEDIKASKTIEKVWIEGIEVPSTNSGGSATELKCT
ncbi:MAG: hypothetical protein LQ340_004182 [Diploschistes diacapsis]|nr:MAG: hypothetical protein LQ340_004182 [Diploschistes diacapsis]